jgi:glycerol-3-phosphate dehydrogenase (NAD(P)+)
LFRFGKAFGARPETLTAVGCRPISPARARSRATIPSPGAGPRQPPAVHESGAKLAEGVFTAPVLLEMAKEKSIELPIASAVVAILSGRMSVDEATETLLTRPFRAES